MKEKVLRESFIIRFLITMIIKKQQVAAESEKILWRIQRMEELYERKKCRSFTGNKNGTEQPEKKRDKKKDDLTLTILMAVASGLCLGIVGILIYWIEAFLK